MPRFEPFQGLRFDPATLAEVTAPPYDVIDDRDRARLALRSPFNAVHLDLPVDEGDEDRYQVACRLLRQWRDDGVLRLDAELSYYLYRAGQTVGAIGALELTPLGEGVLPHERTTPRAWSDRLEMLRACRANLSPVWGLSLAEGLDELVRTSSPSLAAWEDEDGAQHELWRLTDPERLARIAAVVASAPVLIADGHHRWETSLAYRDERRAEADGAGGPYDFAMAYVVELAGQRAVRPIHRVLSGLPDGFDLAGAMAPVFDVRQAGAAADDADALVLVVDGGRRYELRPRDGADQPDSVSLEAALAALPPHDVTYEHRADHALKQVESGAAQAAVLLRAPTVAQIAAAARAGHRLPPKTSFFWPKPRTGAVFRHLN